MSVSELPSMPVNGNYAAQQAQGYGIPEQNFVSHNASNSTSIEYAHQTTTTTNGTESPSKEEVGWYFVEQYYTTLSRSPDRLYLFYNKRSQFLMGTEAEKVMTAVGQKAINEKILEQEVKECKVRVSNVDTQGSGQNIVIQVIGEISINGAPQKKFTQTFVLAEQTNGYFVLNDIFRFLIEEDEEETADEEQQQQAAATQGEQALPLPGEAISGHQESIIAAKAVEPDAPLDVQTSLTGDAAREPDALLVDQSIKEVITDGEGHVEPPAAAVNGADLPAATEIAQAEEAPAAATLRVGEAPQSTDHLADVVRAEDIVNSEKPQDPEPTRAPTPPKVAEPSPAVGKPAAPKTWANLVAGGNRVVLPAAPTSTTPASATQPKAIPTAPAAVSTQTAPVAVTPPVATSAATEDSDRPATPKSAGSEWQTAQRHDHGKKHPRALPTGGPEQNRGYIKNVGEEVDFEELKSHVAKFGELHYFDINRSKRCAFVDWKEPKGYQAATAANPHRLSNVTINVEERHVKPPGVVANSGNFRGNFRSNSRGGYGDRGGRGGAGRGRGGARGGRGGGVPAPA